MTRSSSNLTVLVGYWSIGIVLAATYLQEDIFRSKTIYAAPNRRWTYLLLASVLVVWIDTYIYHRCCVVKHRPLDVPTLIMFPIINGFAETAIFLTVFKVGGQLVTSSRPTWNIWWSFLGGMIPYYIFITLIHLSMWIRILPDHMNDSPKVRLYRRLFIPSKSILATSWALLYFLYHDVWSVIGLHTLIDIGCVISLRYSLWDKPMR